MMHNFITSISLLVLLSFWKLVQSKSSILDVKSPKSISLKRAWLTLSETFNWKYELSLSWICKLILKTCYKSLFNEKNCHESILCKFVKHKTNLVKAFEPLEDLAGLVDNRKAVNSNLIYSKNFWNQIPPKIQVSR